ncbi:MAG: DUF1425 domain-containing protein [Thermodesulfobacteriota bacterium]|nr:DUF1425 domain-containing protein [Thermodesulfobacteriota bacterium]
MRYLTGTVICLFAATAMTAGCSTVSQPEPGLNTNSNQEIIHTRAVDTSFPGLKRVIASDYLIGYISVVNPKLGQTGNFSKAQATVQNLTQNRYELECQYQWEDLGGFAVGSPRPWKRFVLGPKEAKNFSEMALRQDAKQAIFTIRLVDDTFIELNKQVEKNR